MPRPPAGQLDVPAMLFGNLLANIYVIDATRGLLYFGTGENYSSPADHTSDAVFAVEMETGDVRWIRQVTANDAWNMGCVLPDRTNCPSENGPDLDFAASTYLLDRDGGQDVVIAGQKSGWVYGLDPDAGGRILWQKRVGRGGIQGGIHFGMAARETRVFVPISDYVDPRVESDPGSPGLYALDALTGTLLWEAPARDICNGRQGCSPGISAAVTAAPGVVIAGGMDGVLRIHRASNGELLREFNSVREFDTVNGVSARGGSFGGPGAVVDGRQVFVNSGYGIYGHMPGNALLVFSPGKQDHP